MGEIIDGRKIAQNKLEALKRKIVALKQAARPVPQLAVILVGDDPASQVYVQHKAKACENVGITSHVYRLEKASTHEQVLALIERLNADREIDGILLQLPVPAHLNAHKLIAALNPAKDVDGLTPINQGLLALNQARLVPCTPLGIMELLAASKITLEGKHAVVVGRSVLVGAPVARLLEQAGATVTVVHSRTLHPEEYCQRADILVVATGRHHLVGRNWVKSQAVVIDVGIHRRDNGLEGDVDFKAVAPLVRAITPVPGGVGPMTIACLLANCLKAYELRRS